MRGNPSVDNELAVDFPRSLDPTQQSKSYTRIELHAEWTTLFLCFILCMTCKDNSSIPYLPTIDFLLSLIYLAGMYMDHIDLFVDAFYRFNG